MRYSAATFIYNENFLLTPTHAKMFKFLNSNRANLLVGAIVGAVVIWYAYYDHKPYSLELNQISQVALQPKEATMINGVQVVVDGKQVESPYLSVIELTNKSSKSIPKADFESPIEILVGEGVNVVRAQVTATNPNDIDTHIGTNENVVTLSPLLLNSNDTITISVLTSGKPLAFTPHARITNISSITLNDITKKTTGIMDVIDVISSGIISLCLFLSYSCFGSMIIREPITTLNWNLTALISITTYFSSLFVLIKFMHDIRELNYFHPLFALIPLIVIGFLLDFFWVRKQRQETTKTS